MAERKMFGGLVFLVHGNMCCGATRRGLMVRVGSEGREEALKQAHTRPMTMRGRELAGFILIDDEGWETDSALTKWVRRGIEFALSLPPKASTRRHDKMRR
jgi:TfoX/Sxy family transcriptional regulator of competence genes